MQCFHDMASVIIVTRHCHCHDFVTLSLMWASWRLITGACCPPACLPALVSLPSRGPRQLWKQKTVDTQTPRGLWCRDPPVAPDHGHVVHTALVAVGELLEADLRLSVHRVLALSRHTGLSIWKLFVFKGTKRFPSLTISSLNSPLLCLSLGSNNNIAIPRATCSPTWVQAKNVES